MPEPTDNGLYKQVKNVFHYKYPNIVRIAVDVIENIRNL